MIEKYCVICGKKYTPNKNDRKSKYCSLYCRDRRFVRKCVYCSIEFFGRKDKNYCSDYCKKKHKPIVYDNRKQTLLKKYGTTDLLNSKEIREKVKNNNLKKYGYEYPLQSKLIYEKTKQTCLERYGERELLKLNHIRNKIKQTNLEKYGVDNPNKNKEVKQKVEKTNLKKYGVKNPFQSEEIKEKIKKTNLKKYGVIHNNQKHIINYENYNEEFIKENFLKDKVFLGKDFLNYFGIRNYINLNKYKEKFGITETTKKKFNKHQLELFYCIDYFYTNKILFNDKKVINPLELDLYIPDKNIAIEYDGLLFHSYGISQYSIFNNYDKENKNYHLQKTELCEQKNIKLFHIFENEWLDPIKQEIWKSMIKNSLGFSDTKIYARKCELKIINDNFYLEFLENNHLQGSIPSSIKTGLYYNNELVSIMTFGKSRFNKNYDWELLRFCNKMNTSVIGSFSKLLNYFKQHYKGKIISYGNRRWCSILNNVYKKNGGKLVSVSKPNYYYFEFNNDNKQFYLYSRQSFQKHKLKNKLEIFDSNITETENMYNNGYRKIYDCGNLVYEL